MEEKILIIEDNEEIIQLIKDILKKRELKIDYSFKGKDGIKRIEENEYNLVILDLELPDIDGFKVLEEIKKINYSLPVIVLTAFGSTENIVKAIKMGAEDFIEKPFGIERLTEAIEKATRVYYLEREISRLKVLEKILELNRNIISLTDITMLFEKIYSILTELYSPERIGIYLADEEGKKFILKTHKIKKIDRRFRIIYEMKEISELFRERNLIFDDKPFFHNELKILLKGKERDIGVLEIDFPKNRRIGEIDLSFLELFSLQIGIGIENALLFEMVQKSYINAISSLIKSLEAKDRYTKGHSEEVAYYSFMIGKQLGLKDEEVERLKISAFLHDLGKLGIKDEILTKPGKLDENEFEIIKKHPLITVEILEPLNLKREEKEACLYHHERIDGSGYPFGISGESIPTYAKIIAVADAYSAMTSERPYRRKMSKEEAIEELRRCAGKQFDRDIVELFIEIINKIGEVRKDEGN